MESHIFFFIRLRNNLGHRWSNTGKSVQFRMSVNMLLKAKRTLDLLLLSFSKCFCVLSAVRGFLAVCPVRFSQVLYVWVYWPSSPISKTIRCAELTVCHRVWKRMRTFEIISSAKCFNLNYFIIKFWPRENNSEEERQTQLSLIINAVCQYWTELKPSSWVNIPFFFSSLFSPKSVTEIRLSAAEVSTHHIYLTTFDFRQLPKQEWLSVITSHSVHARSQRVRGFTICNFLKILIFISSLYSAKPAVAADLWH